MLADSAELFLVVPNPDSAGSVEQHVYDYRAFGNPSVSDELIASPVEAASGATGSGSTRVA